MIAVLLAGALGTRISEETHLKPKPMIEIGGKPILWHIMMTYSAHGVNDFIVCCGYKGYMIKEYFANYFLHMSDVTFDMEHNRMQVHQRNAEPRRVTLVDTGETTMTGGRLKRVASYLRSADFLDLNVAFLDEHPDYVASTCPNWFEDQSPAAAVRFAMQGSPEERFASFFQQCWQSHAIFYSLIRTQDLRQCEVLGTSFIAVDWAVDLFLASRGQVNRTAQGHAIFGRGGASQRVGAYRAFRNQRLEVILPFFRFGAYAWKLGRTLPVGSRLRLLAALVRLNLLAVKDQSVSALYQWYGRNLKPLVRKQFP